MSKDFVDDLVAKIQAAAPDLPHIKVEAIAAGIRATWGGDRVYIRKAPAEGKVLALGAALASGASVSEAFAAAGVNRRTGYRLLRRRWLAW